MPQTCLLSKILKYRILYSTEQKTSIRPSMVFNNFPETVCCLYFSKYAPILYQGSRLRPNGHILRQYFHSGATSFSVKLINIICVRCKFNAHKQYIVQAAQPVTLFCLPSVSHLSVKKKKNHKAFSSRMLLRYVDAQ